MAAGGKSSKRQRKERSSQALRQKRHTGGAQNGSNTQVLLGADLDILSDDLKAQLSRSGINGINDVAVPPHAVDQVARVNLVGLEDTSAEQTRLEAALSKGARRKLKQVQRKKQLRDSLEQVLLTLHQHKVVDGQLALLRPMHQRGHRETKRQQLRRALKMQRAGMTLNAEDQEALQPVPGGPRSRAGAQAVASSGQSDGSSGSDDEDTRARSHAQAGPGPGSGGSGQVQVQPWRAAVAARTPAGQRSHSSNGSSSDGECVSASAGSPGPPDGPAAKRRRQRDAVIAVPAAAAAASGLPGSGDACLGIADAGTTMEAASQNTTKLLHGDVRKLQEAARQAAAEESASAAGTCRTVADDLDKDVLAGPGGGIVAPDRAAGASTALASALRHRVVLLQRPEAMAQARMELPILGQEQELMEAVAEHDVVVLCGETGCGKTTQVPQFFYEAGYGCREFPERAGLVGVTQPRRVAAISTAERVAAELGESVGSTVGYQVRHDRSVGHKTCVKFMTDGILLREVQSDLLLSRYSALLVDEAHERSLGTDLLIGMLSRIVPLRRKLWQAQQARQAAGTAVPADECVYPLKLVIMSATLRTADFTANARLFAPPPPLIKVPARQYPVTVHFARKTELEDYEAAALRKALRIHRELPPGGILIFLTGQREVEHMCSRLRQQVATMRTGRGGVRVAVHKDAAAGLGSSGGSPAEEQAALDFEFGGDHAEAAGDAANVPEHDNINELDDYEQMEEDEDEDETHMLGGNEAAAGFSMAELAAAEAQFEQRYGLCLSSRPIAAGSPAVADADVPKGTGGTAAGTGQDRSTVPVPGMAPPVAPVHVLPLYAMMPQAEQARVFQPPPEGHRLIVVATNVAETSLTIPGIRYVVDMGRAKQRLLEQGGVMARYEVGWISQASAAQRAGRAGRTGPGHCYRLYSSAHFNDNFEVHSAPEILNAPLEGVVLLMKSMGVAKVHNFPFPTPPEPAALRAAVQCLIALSALEPSANVCVPHGTAGAGAGANPGGALTPLGRAMAHFPISPRHARMLLEALSLQQRGVGAAVATTPSAAVPGVVARHERATAQLVPFAVALAAVMSVESPFVHIDTIKADGDVAPSTVGEDAPAEAPDLAAHAAAAQQHRRQQHARAAHVALGCPDSDALSALAALLAFEAAGETDAFCRASYLHSRNLREAAALHRQLLAALAAPPSRLQQLQGAGAGSCIASDLAGQLASVVASATRSKLALGSCSAAALPRLLTKDMQDCLRRTIAAGWADQVSRRVRSLGHAQQHTHVDGRRRRAVRYQSCRLAPDAAPAARAAEGPGADPNPQQHVFLHPNSGLASAAPEFLVYSSLLRTVKRPYMVGVTAVEPTWLVQCGTPLCRLSQPLLEPPPVFSASADCVLSWHAATYGRHAWELPPHPQRHPDAAERAAVFAAALLSGAIVPGFAELRSMLVMPPESAARHEMRGVARVGELLDALQRHGIDSRAGLAAAWKAEPTLLRTELARWLPVQQHKRLVQLWPLLLQQSTAAVHTPAVAWKASSKDTTKDTSKRVDHKQAVALGTALGTRGGVGKGTGRVPQARHKLYGSSPGGA